MGPIVAQVWVQMSHENGVVTMVTKLNPSWTHIEKFKLYIHLRSLNASLFGEGMGVKSMESRSP
jgi:hypothetical protein